MNISSQPDYLETVKIGKVMQDLLYFYGHDFNIDTQEIIAYEPEQLISPQGMR